MYINQRISIQFAREESYPTILAKVSICHVCTHFKTKNKLSSLSDPGLHFVL